MPRGISIPAVQRTLGSAGLPARWFRHPVETNFPSDSSHLPRGYSKSPSPQDAVTSGSRDPRYPDSDRHAHSYTMCSVEVLLFGPFMPFRLLHDLNALLRRATGPHL